MVYTKEPKGQLKLKDNQKTAPMSYLKLHQSTKSNMKKVLSHKKLYIKNYLIVDPLFSLLLKTLQFFPFQMVQKKHKGAVFQNFFSSFS